MSGADGDRSEGRAQPDGKMPLRPPPGRGGRWAEVRHGWGLLRDQLGHLTAVQRCYGDVALVRLGLGAGAFVLVSSPQGVQTILVGHADRYSKAAFNVPTLPFMGEGLLTTEGEIHDRDRSWLLPWFEQRHVRTYADTMMRLIETRLATWRDGQTVEIFREMRSLVLRILAASLFDVELDAGRIPFDQAFEHRALVTGPFAPRLPRLDLPFTGYGRHLRAMAVLDGAIRGWLAQPRRLCGAGPGRSQSGDILSAMVQGAGGGSSFDERHIADHVKTLLLAGQTTTSALSFTLYLLATHPAERRRLSDELRRRLAGRTPSPADLSELPYLDAVVRESLRLYPPAYVLGRKTTSDDEIGGYAVPAGTYVLVSPWVVHRRPDLWPRADAFLPERWLPRGQGGQHVVPYSYLPFGGGHHTCIGMSFALQELKLALATILQRFVPEWPAGRRLRLVLSINLVPAPGTRLRIRRVDAAAF